MNENLPVKHVSENCFFNIHRILPFQPEMRGSHVSLGHSEAYRINSALIGSPHPAIKAIPDFREPDNIRLGVAPIYTTFTENYKDIDRMRTIVKDKIYKKYFTDKTAVT